MWGRPSPTSSISPCLATQPLRRKRCALLLQLNKKQVTSTSMEGQQKGRLAHALWLVEVESSATNASASSASDLFYPFLSFSCFCMLLHGFEFVSKISMEIGFLYMLPVLPLMLYSFCQILGRGQPASTASQFLLVTLTSNVIGKYWKHMQRDCCCLRSWNSWHFFELWQGLAKHEMQSTSLNTASMN